MTSEEFTTFLCSIQESLFHVERTDIDDDSGARLDEIILIKHLIMHPEALSVRPLIWFYNNFIKL